VAHRSEWHPEPELIDTRDPDRSRAALERLGERTWAEALDWLYGTAADRATAPDLYPDLYQNLSHQVQITYYPPRGDNKESWDAIDLFGWLGYPMQLKIDFLCRDSILAAPLLLDLVLFMDLAKRKGLSGPQEWLSFYFKSPVCLNGHRATHELSVQLALLKSQLSQFVEDSAPCETSASPST